MYAGSWDCDKPGRHEQEEWGIKSKVTHVVNRRAQQRSGVENGDGHEDVEQDGGNGQPEACARPIGSAAASTGNAEHDHSHEE